MSFKLLSCPFQLHFKLCSDVNDTGDDHGEESVSNGVETFLYTALFLINNLS